MLKRMSILMVCLLGFYAKAEPLIGVTTGGNLIFFDSATPGTIDSAVPVNGLADTETLRAADRRPDGGEIFAVTSLGLLTSIDPLTGNMSYIGFLSSPPTGIQIGMDFHPILDRIRITTEVDENRRVDPFSGNTLVDTALTFAPGDPNAGLNPSVTALAYSNNDFRSTTTTLYGIDTATDTLVLLAVPNSGQLTTVGSLGVNLINGGFDISGNTGIAYAAMSNTSGGGTSLYTVDLASGAATLVGAIGLELSVVGLMADVGSVAVPSETIVGLRGDDQLVLFDSATPEAPGTVINLAPLVSGEGILELDTRPADGNLYAYGSQGNLYAVNPLSGAAYLLGNSGIDTVGSYVGFDFNPVADRIRLVTSQRDNYRLDAHTAFPTTDSQLVYQAGDVNELLPPAIATLAYTNSFAGAASTTLYGIDVAQNALVLHAVPNAGTLSTIGTLNITANYNCGFDISGSSGVAYFTNTALKTSLYTLDLSNGGAALVGPVASPAITKIAVLTPFRHSADADANDLISLSELLRVIQLYNIGGFHCAEAPGDTEDGYMPGPGADLGCAPHASDYSPQDWLISLSELLRLIQFYNSLGYYPCPGESEDGLCPGNP